MNTEPDSYRDGTFSGELLAVLTPFLVAAVSQALNIALTRIFNASRPEQPAASADYSRFCELTGRTDTSSEDAGR